MLTEKYPYLYRAYGLNIASQVEISGMEVSIFKKSDVTIQENDVPEKLDSIINKGFIFQSNEHEFLLHLEKLAVFYVKNGVEIIFQRLAKIDVSELSTIINGACFGALMHQRKLLPFHASTVIYRNKGLLIAGISGAGKSTLAAALVRSGGTLVADDISAITFSENKPYVMPALSSIKMWRDSLLHLNLLSPGLKQVRTSLQKYYFPVQDYCKHPAEIHFFLVLNNHNQKEYLMREIHGVEKFQLLKKHTYFLRGISGTNLERDYFINVTSLTSHIPLFLINRPNGAIETHNLISLIIRNLLID